MHMSVYIIGEKKLFSFGLSGPKYTLLRIIYACSKFNAGLTNLCLQKGPRLAIGCQTNG